MEKTGESLLAEQRYAVPVQGEIVRRIVDMLDESFTFIRHGEPQETLGDGLADGGIVLLVGLQGTCMLPIESSVLLCSGVDDGQHLLIHILGQESGRVFDSEDAVQQAEGITGKQKKDLKELSPASRADSRLVHTEKPTCVLTSLPRVVRLT